MPNNSHSLPNGTAEKESEQFKQPDQLRNGFDQTKPKKSSQFTFSYPECRIKTLGWNWEEHQERKIEEINRLLEKLQEENQVKCLECFRDFRKDEIKEKWKIDYCCNKCHNKIIKAAEERWKKIEISLGINKRAKHGAAIKNYLGRIVILTFFLAVWDPFWNWYEAPSQEEWDLEDGEMEPKKNWKSFTWKEWMRKWKKTKLAFVLTIIFHLCLLLKIGWNWYRY